MLTVPYSNDVLFFEEKTDNNVFLHRSIKLLKRGPRFLFSVSQKFPISQCVCFFRRLTRNFGPFNCIARQNISYRQSELKFLVYVDLASKFSSKNLAIPLQEMHTLVDVVKQHSTKFRRFLCQ